MVNIFFVTIFIENRFKIRVNCKTTENVIATQRRKKIHIWIQAYSAAVKNNIISIKKTNFWISYVGIEKCLKTCVLLWRFLRSFSSYNSKTNAVRKILSSDLESASKNTSIKRKK